MKRKSHFQQLNHDDYEQLIHAARVIEADGHGPKVYELADGSMLKLFRQKRLISYASIYPYAQRFYDNCIALKALSIPCPEPIALLNIPSIKRHAVHYFPLPGKTVRELLKTSDNSALPHLRLMLGEFIADLHELGIYFRSVHMGNIILTPDRKLGLIDVADLKLMGKSLSKPQRTRNFRHITRYKDESEVLFESKTFHESYSKRTQHSLK